MVFPQTKTNNIVICYINVEYFWYIALLKMHPGSRHANNNKFV